MSIFSRWRRRTPCLFLLLFAFASADAVDDQWPQFRGPDGQGHSDATELPVHFGLNEGVVWRTPIIGKGWSSPVVADGKIWFTTAVSSKLSEDELKRRLEKIPFKEIKEIAATVDFYAVCVAADSGEIVHLLKLNSVNDPDPINPLNTYASPTPAIDQGRVFCHFGNYGTWCLDANTGETIWQQKIAVDYSVGPGSSPIVCGDKLILACDGCDQQFVMALEKSTGQVAWKTERPPIRADNVELKKSFCSPLVIDVAGNKQVVVPGAQWIAAYDPATGEEIWRFDHGDGYSLSGTPLFSHGLVIFSTGYNVSELVAVRPDGRGDVTKTHLAWRARRGAPNKPSAIVVGDEIYVVSDNGVLTQLHIADGTEVWRKRIGTEFSASPVAAGEKIYFPSHDGTVVVVQAGPTFQLLAENKLEPRLMASPAVFDDDLIIRSEQALFRVSK